MNEQSWLASEDPAAMLRLITENPYHANINCVSARKLRLFACACFRLVKFDYISDVSVRAAEESEVWGETGIPPKCHPRVRNDAAENWSNPLDHALSACHWVDYHGSFNTEKAALLREIVGNPFRPVLAIPGWSGTAVRIAQSIYDRRAFDETGALADALDDAGADNTELLAHLRGEERCIYCSGRGWWIIDSDPTDHSATCPHCHGTGWRPLRVPHALGCWALDLVRGKA